MAEHSGRVMVGRTWDRYVAWSKLQTCVDCHRTKAETGTEIWATEHQCLICWNRHGSPERRGLPSALDLFDRFTGPNP